MTKKSASLRAVQDDEKPPPPAKDIETVLDAAEHGSRLDELVQMRRVIARAMDSSETTATALAALSRRLDDISREIASLKQQEIEEAEESDAASDDEWSEEAI